MLIGLWLPFEPMDGRKLLIEASATCRELWWFLLRFDGNNSAKLVPLRLLGTWVYLWMLPSTEMDSERQTSIVHTWLAQPMCNEPRVEEFGPNRLMQMACRSKHQWSISSLGTQITNFQPNQAGAEMASNTNSKVCHRLALLGIA